jgi:hypothetical protein
VSPIFVPETVTVNAEDCGVAEAVQESVEAPDGEPLVSAILAGLRTQVRPVDGEMELVRATVPVNPLALDTVMVDVPVPPAKIRTPVGLALTVKSCTM